MGTFTDQHLRALGRVTVTFSTLHTILSEIVSDLIGSDTIAGLIITSQLSMPQLLDAFSSLYRYRLYTHARLDQGRIEELDRLLGKVKQVEQARNAVTHSRWLAAQGGDERPTRVKVTARMGKGLRANTQPLTSQDIDALADRIEAVGQEIVGFLEPDLAVLPSFAELIRGTDRDRDRPGG